MNKALLLVIDFINDIAHEEGKLSRSADFLKEHQVMEHANQAIAFARAKQLPIAHVKVGFSKNYIDCPAHSPLFGKAKEFNVLQLDSWGTEFHEKMDVQENDIILTKHRVSAFYETGLATILGANQIDTLIICGVATNMTVELTAREAHDRDYHVIVLQDACGTVNQQQHAASLAVIERIAKVINVTDLSQHIKD